MKAKKSILTGLLTLVCASSAALAVPARHHDPPVWSADKTLVSELAVEPQPISDYAIQPPPAWEPQLRGGPGKIGTEFDGPTDQNGNHPFLEVMVMGLPNWGVDKRTPDDFLSLRLNNVKRMLNDWKPSKFEDGTINGIPFARCRWTGTTMANANKIAGFMYVGREGTYVVEIQGAESLDKADKTLPLLEASAMTFQKRLKPLVLAPPTPYHLPPSRGERRQG